jgi:copper(I)-binding protein
MRLPNPRMIRRLPAVLAVLTLAGCSTQPPFQDLPAGGVDATTGQVVVDDIWVAGPYGLTAGSDAPLRLTMTNEASTAGDALVGVSTPVAARAVLQRDGKDVDRIALPAGAQTDLEWRTGVELEGLRGGLEPGQWFPVTLRFARAAPVTVLVAAGPLAAAPPGHHVESTIANPARPITWSTS